MDRPVHILGVAVAIALAIVLLHLLVPGPAIWWNWGFALFGLLPGWAPWVLLGFWVTALLLAGRLWRRKEITRDKEALRGGSTRAWLPALVASVGCGILFKVFETPTHFLGDAALRIRNLADHRHGISYSALDQWVLYRVFEPLEARWGLDPEVFLSWVSILSGMLSSFLLVWWIWKTQREPMARWFLVLLTGGSAYVLVFFGYTEQYAPQCLAVLLFLVVAHRVVEGPMHIAWLLLAFWIAVAVHRSSAVLGLSVLYLLWRDLAGVRSRESPSARARRAAPVVFLACLTAVACGLLFRGLGVTGTPGGLFVPITAGGTDTLRRAYTLFSGIHWANVINQHLLLSPVGLLLLAVFLPQAIRAERLRDPWVRFVSLAALPWLLLSLVWASDLGAPRDWDIFTPAALAYTLLAGTLVLPVLAEQPGNVRKSVVVLLVGASLFHTVPWIWVNAVEGAARSRFESLVTTERGWGTYGHAYAVHELGAHDLGRGRPLEAAAAFVRAGQIDPHARYDFEAGAAFLEAGDTEKAVRYLAEAVKKNPGLVDPYVYLGMAYLKAGMPDAALGFLETALRLKPEMEDIREVVETLRAGGTADFEFRKE